MKLYDSKHAPNPRRVRIFLAEKGIVVPIVQVNLRDNEQFSAGFGEINPFRMVPVLELDDGLRISESVAICRYFEEVHPEPALFGRDPVEKAVVEEWQRRVEFDGFQPVMETFRNSTPGLKGRALPGPHGYEQIPEIAERGRKRIANFLRLLDWRLADHEFIAGPNFSVADITVLTAYDFGFRAKVLVPPEDAPHLKRWHEAVSRRASASA